jgi:hypothetical protein
MPYQEPSEAPLPSEPAKEAVAQSERRDSEGRYQMTPEYSIKNWRTPQAVEDVLERYASNA